MARSTDKGATWTAAAPLNSNAATDSGGDEYPQVTTDGAGHWVAVWTSWDAIGTDWDILVSRSTDNGVTWTARAALNTNAATDSGNDYGPQATTDGGSNWVAVWSSTENLGGTIGGDSDIFYATEGPPVGGIAELLDVSDSSAPNYIALAGLAAAALVALGAGGWYARRRWLG